MEILKPGIPVDLYGECGGCHAVVRTTTAEALLVPSSRKSFEVPCAACNCFIAVYYVKPGSLSEWLSKRKVQHAA